MQAPLSGLCLFDMAAKRKQNGPVNQKPKPPYVGIARRSGFLPVQIGICLQQAGPYEHHSYA